MTTENVTFVAGPAFSVGSVSWSGSSAVDSIKAWLPNANEPLVHQVGSMWLINPRWYRFMDEITKRLGGINGDTITQVSTSVQQTQDSLVRAATAINTAAQTVNAAADSVNTIKQVLVNNGTSGSTSIPDAPRVSGTYVP